MQRTQGTRQRILDAGRELLAERGSAVAVTLDDIAMRAGTTKATLYRYFPSKANLITAAMPLDAPVIAGAGRRDQILDAAVTVVVRYGLGGTTMERIAAEADTSPAALYWHFTDKAGLISALIERFGATVNLGALIEAAADVDPEAALRGFVPRAMAAQRDQLDLLRVMLMEAATEPELAAVVYDRVIGRLWGELAGYMQGQAERGAFRPGPALLRVIALVGMLLTYNLARRAFGDRLDLPPPDEAAAEMVQIFLHGVAQRDAGGHRPA